MQDTILHQISDHGVEINGLIIPGRLIESVLSRHVFNLIVKNDDEVWEASLLGSATAIRYRGREILLTTQHQLRGSNESQVGMLTDSGSHIITSGGVRRYKPRSDSDVHDIVAFDFSEPCADRPELKKRFFELRDEPPDVLNIHVLAILLSGFPFADQTFEPCEKNHLGLCRRNVVCRPGSQPNDESLITVQALKPLDKHSDGMSGGSAFVVQLEGGRRRAYFAGIIVRGGKETFYILKVGYVLAFLNAVFD